ncbi:transcriptional regulator [Rhodococcus erythropolis]|uniref:transcriptional regulator n=1 Tax=Rhodococcus qingshengii TaxID=334542 RepID=UPI0035FBC8E0
MTGASHTFGEQLNELFAGSPRRITNTAVARALTEQGCSISIPYLSQLRSGVRTRPADRYVRALAEHFGVPLSHFYETPFESGTDTGLESDLELIQTIDDDAVRRLLSNAHGLSPESLDILIRFEDHLRVLV